MKKISILLTFLYLATMGFSQHEKYSLEFRKVTQHEMVMKEYENDPNADAVMLYNQGEYHYTGNYTEGRFYLRMTREVKIKILKQSGVQYADFEIPIYNGNSGWETVESIEGTTYNMDTGLTQTELKSKNIFEEKVNDYVRVKKIAFSDVRPGSVIELKYTIVTPYYFNMRKWYFQQRIPVIYSKLRYRAIPYCEYAYILKGTNKLDIIDSHASVGEIRFGNLAYREMIYDFGMKELPAFRDEDFISSVDDYMINMNFQLSKFYHPNGSVREVMTTWPNMCDEFLKDDTFGKYIRNVEKQASKIMHGIDLKGKSDKDKIEIITDFVKSKFKWDGSTGKFADLSLKDFLKEQSGNVGNINLLLTGLFRSAGVEAYPVILSTRGNGIISLEHPFQQFFNYVIVMAVSDGRTTLHDATEPLLHYAVLPERCMNVDGLVIKPKSDEWITIQQRISSQIQKNLKLEINPETNSVQAEVMYLTMGPDAYRFRSAYRGNPESLTKYLKDRENINITDLKLPETMALDKPFTFFFQLEGQVDNQSDKLFFNPFCTLNFSKNPFSQSERKLPVDLVYLRAESYKSTITIPEGYIIEHIPENQTIEDDLFSFSYITAQSDNQLLVNAEFNIKQFIIKASEYENLKENFNKMIKSLSDMVVLAKEE